MRQKTTAHDLWVMIEEILSPIEPNSDRLLTKEERAFVFGLCNAVGSVIQENRETEEISYSLYEKMQIILDKVRDSRIRVCNGCP